jgi:hypothetical protein
MKRIVSVVLILMLAFGSVSFAATFKDVSASFWGYSFINEVADKGIVAGYTDGTFKPNDSISKYASVVMIYRAMRSSNLVPTASISAYRTKHSLTLITYEVPDWTDLKDAVAYFLEVGVLSIADLKNFTDLGKLQNASRQDVSIFLGRALNLQLKVASQMNNLSFKDAALISNAAAPYVSILVNQQIVAGDTAGYFKPHDPVTRAQMAKMISLSLKTWSNYGQTEEKMAIVKLILKDTKKVVFYDQANASITYIEKIDFPVKVLSGTTEKSFNDLVLDQVVKLVYQGSTLTRVELVSANQTVTGEITSLISLADKVILSVKTAAGTQTLVVTSTTPVTQNAIADSYMNLLMGYQVVATVNGDNVIKLDYQKTATAYDGIVTEAVTVVTVPIIKIRVGQEIKTFEFADSAIIKRNDVKVSMADLIAGDVVTFKTSLGKITEITALSTKTSASGTIQELTISANPVIKIKTSSGVVETYTVSAQVTVKLDDKTVTLYDLRANYAINAKIESNQITAITATSVTKRSSLIGTVVNVYPDLSIFTIQDSEGKIHTVHIQNSTLFLTRTGAKDDLDIVDKDDYVFVYGTFQDSFMVAEKVLELE